jgi:hypothetical protein
MHMKKRSKMIAVALIYYATVAVLVLALLGIDEFLNSNHHDWLGVVVLSAAVVTTVTVLWRTVLRHLEQY